MELDSSLQVDAFKELFATFLNQLKQGSLLPTSKSQEICNILMIYMISGKLLPKKWPPLRPPYHFPSSENQRELKEDIGEMDISHIPMAEPAKVKEHPMYEDKDELWRHTKL